MLESLPFEELQKLVFTSHVETKGMSSGRKVIKYFLLDTAGNRHLAAVGHDSGSAHYDYSSVAHFGRLAGGDFSAHNRTAVVGWLDYLIRSSKARASGQGLAADDSSDAAGEPQAKLNFVSYRQERSFQPLSGRRINRWYLVDQAGGQHLAVVGEERETKDAHYTYQAEAAFADRYPLSCQNQAGVLQWLDSLLTSSVYAAPGGTLDLQDIRAHALASSGGGRGSGGAPKGSGSGLPKGRPSGSAHSLGEHQKQQKSAKPMGSKHKLFGVAESSHLKRQRQLQAQTEAALVGAQQSHLASLRQAAVAEAAKRKAVRHMLDDWVRGPVPDSMAQWVASCHRTLRQLLDNAHKGSELQSSPYLQPHPDASASTQPARPGGALDLTPPSTAAPIPPPAASADLTPPAAVAQPTQPPAVGAAPAQWQLAAGTAAAPATASCVAPPVPQPSEMHDVSIAFPPASLSHQADFDCLAKLASWPLQPQAPSGAAPARSAAAAPSCAAPASSPQNALPTASSAAAAAAAAVPAPITVAPVPVTVPSGWVLKPANTWCYSDPLLHRHGLRMAIHALRDLAAGCLPTQVLSDSGIVDTVRQFTEHPHPVVATQAREVLRRWRDMAVQRARALLDPQYTQDPVEQLEARIATGRVVYPTEPVTGNTAGAVAPTAMSGGDDKQASQALTPLQDAAGTPPLASPALGDVVMLDSSPADALMLPVGVVDPRSQPGVPHSISIANAGGLMPNASLTTPFVPLASSGRGGKVLSSQPAAPPSFPAAGLIGYGQQLWAALAGK